MISHRVAGAPLDFSALRKELEVPGDFAASVESSAEQAAKAASGEVVGGTRIDATDIEFITVDPPGSRDLDQALNIARLGSGYVVRYAIADVAAFVSPADPVDLEARERGQTLYFPDDRVLLHPAVLSEGAASLLPGQLRPAVLWEIELDADARVVATSVRRARVRSRAQLDYAGAQAAIDDGRGGPTLDLLVDVGRRRQELSRERHAIDLNIPEQVVEPDGAGDWMVVLREPAPIEQYNAEISLLTGMCAAQLMLAGDVGLLRTVPPPTAGAVHALRRAAAALGIRWPTGREPGDVLAGLDRRDPRQVALVEHAAVLLRGAGYVAFDGHPPEPAMHAGLGAPYAHVTAPLRRVVDRFGTEVCVALSAGRAVPEWVRAALPTLPEIMRRSDQRAHQVDRAVVDATEAWMLSDRVGQQFSAVVIDADEHAGTVVLEQPAVRARCDGVGLPVGDTIPVRLTVADVATRTVRFTRA